MEKFRVIISKTAQKDIVKLVKSGSKATIHKIKTILCELEVHPRVGTGKPEQLKYKSNIWSRRIDKKNRMVYQIKDKEVSVEVLSAIGHYGDK